MEMRGERARKGGKMRWTKGGRANRPKQGGETQTHTFNLYWGKNTMPHTSFTAQNPSETNCKPNKSIVRGKIINNAKALASEVELVACQMDFGSEKDNVEHKFISSVLSEQISSKGSANSDFW